MIREPHPVLLHDAGLSSHVWRAVAEDLGGVRALYPDLPGFGSRADAPDVTPGASLAAVLEALGTANFERFVLVGHGLSGLLALSVAAARPEGLVGVALVAPTPTPANPTSPGAAGWTDVAAAYSALRSGPDGPVRAVPPEWGAEAAPPGDREILLGDLDRAAPNAWDAWLNPASWTDAAPPQGLPLLVIRGNADPLSFGSEWSDAQDVVVEGGSRLLPLTHPRDVTRHLLHWTRTTLADVTLTADEARAKRPG